VPTDLPACTPAGLLARALAADPAGPLLTQYDDATGERIELSATTLENWVAKTANLIQDGGVEPGSRAAVLLPPHWQTAAILLGCWSAGLVVAAAGGSADLAFAGPDRLDEALATGADEVYGLSLAPLAAPLRDVPPGVTDYATEVRVHGDRFAPYAPVDPASAALAGASVQGAAPHATSHEELVAAAVERAGELGLAAGDRLLIAAPSNVLDWLLAPLAAGASIVLCRHPDLHQLPQRATAERVTSTVGIDVPGMRRADTAPPC
jgi:uncharacterized protein (TIGR03089 family)